MKISQPAGGKEILSGTLFGLIIAFVNISAVILGFMVYCVARPPNQLLIQLPVAFLFSIGGVVIVASLFKRSRILPFDVDCAGTFLITFFFSLLWAPILFVPLHFAGRGYVTSFGNILGLWCFQIPANSVALLLVRTLGEKT